MHDSFLLVLVAVNAYLLVTVALNLVYFRRATRAATMKDGPFVSVIVPARNEELSIARCLRSLLKQDYANYEVIVVDDESSDATADIVSALGSHDARVRLVTGSPLPSDWLGKPHALAEGAKVARGEILILTDADTAHEPESISWAVTNLQSHRADILSGYLRQEYGSLGECVVVPTMYAMMLLVPLFLVARSGSPRFAFAIGQYVVLRRTALDAVGGFEAIKSAIVDDMAMATLLKRNGYRNVFLDAKTAARCRLYNGYRESFRGIKRSIYSALGANPIVAIAVTAIVLALMVGPAFSVLASNIALHAPSVPIAAAVMLFAVQWALVAWDRDMPFLSWLLYPIVFLNLVLILDASMLATGFGHGVEWKGRTVRVPRESDATVEADLLDAVSRSHRLR